MRTVEGAGWTAHLERSGVRICKYFIRTLEAQKGSGSGMFAGGVCGGTLTFTVDVT